MAEVQMPVQLHVGDMREVLAAYDANTFESVVCDPPYGLSFMGKGWDRGVPGVEFWQEALRVAKPGAHLLAFGGTRTFHRLACAIEDAGWELRDCIMWVYGSGFPKSHDVGKAIDREAGAERQKVLVPTRSSNKVYTEGSSTYSHSKHAGFRDVSAPVTDAARQWDGWGTALKPAWEPIIVARKPLAGTVAQNVLEHGTGAMNIDGCRVGFSDGEESPTSLRRAAGHNPANNPSGWKETNRGARFNESSAAMGRWSANLIHDGSDEVLALFPESAARFFYCSKTNRKDRGADNNHPTVKPTALMRYLVKLVTPPGGTVLDPFMGSGSTGKAAALEGFGFVGVDLNPEYVEIAKARINTVEQAC
jgi:DNA modification methylase